MKCGHSRNLFYVSRSCFSFYLLFYLNKWNPHNFFRHLKTTHINTLILYNGIEWNVVIVGIYFTCLKLIHTFSYAVRFHFHGGGRPAASAGGAARPAAGGRRPGQRGVPTRAATADREPWTCGHSRNLFYVSRSCFSFYVHTFVSHLNKWNTRWDFIFIRHLKTTCGI